MRKISALVLVFAAFAIGCKFPNSAAYIDEYFFQLAPNTTQTLRGAFTRTVVLANGTPAVKLYASIQKQKPLYLFLSPLFTSELPTLLETYPRMVPVIISNAPIPPAPMTKGCVVRFDPEDALLLAVQRLAKGVSGTEPQGSLAIITDFSLSDKVRETIEVMLRKAKPALELLYFSASEDVLALTIQELKTKNISKACIAVAGSRLLILIDAIETKPEIIAIIQGEPPSGRLGKYSSVNFLYWDMDNTLKAISAREIAGAFKQIPGAWQFLR